MNRYGGCGLSGFVASRARKNTLIKTKEGDRDFHLVIADPADKKKTIIAEVVDPECRRVCQSKKLEQLKAVQTRFIKQFGQPEDSFRHLDPPAPIVITGVGFFDFRHGQTGVAPNAIELHPVLSVEPGN